MRFPSKELEGACRRPDAKVISLGPREEAEHSQNSLFAEPAWPVLHDAAYYGLAGEVVRSIEPHSEADSVAILLQFLAPFGNAVGLSPYYQVEGDKHRPKLFVVISGATSPGPGHWVVTVHKQPS